MFLAEAFLILLLQAQFLINEILLIFWIVFIINGKILLVLLIKKEQKKNYLKDNRVDGILEYMFKNTRKISNEIG